MPTPLDIVFLLYKHEINCGLESDWDNGFTCWLGNEYSGRTDEITSVRDPERITEWFDGAARRSLAAAVQQHRIPQAYADAYARDADAMFGRPGTH